MSGCVRRGEYRGGAPQGERARSANGVATFVRVARAGPRSGTAKKYAPFGAPPPFIYLGRLDGLSYSVQQTSDAIAASRERERFAFTSPRVRGEVRSEATRMRGPLRDSERCGWCPSVSDAAARLRPAESSPHPNLLPARGEKERAAKLRGGHVLAVIPPPAAGRSGGRAWRGRKAAPPRGRCGRSGRVRGRARAASAAMRARHAARPG